MAPLRRYLRITKYSVLECRIYLDNPALAQSWLLNPRDPVLPRVIESVRPLVLPKLREERERSRKKSTKKRGIKDTITEGACSPIAHIATLCGCASFFFLFFFSFLDRCLSCFLCSQLGGGEGGIGHISLPRCESRLMAQTLSS